MSLVYCGYDQAQLPSLTDNNPAISYNIYPSLGFESGGNLQSEDAISSPGSLGKAHPLGLASVSPQLLPSSIIQTITGCEIVE